MEKPFPIFCIALQILKSELSWLTNRFLQIIPSVSNCSYFFPSQSLHLNCTDVSTIQFVNHFSRPWSVNWNQYFRSALINTEENWEMSFLDFDTIFLLIQFRVAFAFPGLCCWFTFIKRSWWFSCLLLCNIYTLHIL